MKIVAKPIEMLAWFEDDGTPHPVKFKITNKDETESTIKIDRIIKQSEEKLARNRMLIYLCQGEVAGKERPFEIKFELCSCNLFWNKGYNKKCH